MTEQLALQAAALREKELQLEEMDRQLRLLFDLQKRAEDEKKAAEADVELQKLKVQKEQEARALETENALWKQKVEEAGLNAAKLAELEKVVLELQKPKPNWFQKLFLTSSQG